MTTDEILEPKGYIPHIKRSHFDDVAEAILRCCYPSGLTEPAVIPIEQIAQDRLGLTILEGRLSEDLSVFGMICYQGGRVDLYDKENDEYTAKEVEAGTMIIDPDTQNLRNVGCKRNTVAHECVHWIMHRGYCIRKASVNEEICSSCRCPVEPNITGEKEEWTDLDWMEWQANGIAPRILMPRETAVDVFNDLLVKSKSTPEAGGDRKSQLIWITRQFADFYQVSQLSALIRLKELDCVIR